MSSTVEDPLSSSHAAVAAAATLPPLSSSHQVAAADSELTDASSNGGTRPHATRDIDGREIRDYGDKVDLKFILAHSPNVDEEDDEDPKIVDASADGYKRSPIANVDEVLTATTSALLESQFQPVDDDDLEYGEFVDDEDFNNTTPVGRRQRRSSLKHILRSPSTEVEPRDPSSSCDCVSPSAGGESSSGRSSPGSGSLHERKAVRFVDGPGLEERREVISSDEPPEIPESALKDLRVRRRKKSQSILTWALDFEQPGSDPGFVNRVLKNKVALENCIAPTDRDQRLTISGTVRVANIAYDKHVVIQWTADSWSPDGMGTFHETAGYMPGSSDGSTDRFAFLICPPSFVLDALTRQLHATIATSGSVPSARIELVVSYEAGGVTYWDNNDRRNYGIVISAVATPPVSCDSHSSAECDDAKHQEDTETDSTG